MPRVMVIDDDDGVREALGLAAPPHVELERASLSLEGPSGAALETARKLGMVPVQVAFIPVLTSFRELVPGLELTKGYGAVWLAHTAFGLPLFSRTTRSHDEWP